MILYMLFLRVMWWTSMTLIVVDAITEFSLFITRSVQLTSVPFKPLLTLMITNLDTRGNSFWLETRETLNTVELTVIFETCWDTPTEEMNLINLCTCPCSFISGDDDHPRIVTFVEHVSSRGSPSHIIAASLGYNSKPADQDCHVTWTLMVIVFFICMTWNLSKCAHLLH